mmetsp:Transcript_34105/g.59481  ORF Transcript_34105/g.59481 Transcript_34105/m.59481 type:complete len:279 (+) Transcript_34105:2848-3684(+)
MESALKISHIVQMKDPKTIKRKKQIRWNSVGSTDLCQSIFKSFERSANNSPALKLNAAVIKASEKVKHKRAATEFEPHFVSGSNLDKSIPPLRKSLDNSTSSQPSSPTNGQKSVLDSWVKSMGYVFANKYNHKLNLRPGIFLSDAQIRTGMSRFYGAGDRRALRPGEKSLVTAKIRDFIEEAKHNPEVVANGTRNIIFKVLENCHLQRLARYTSCMREIEGLWRTAISKQTSSFLGSLPRKPVSPDPVLEDIRDGEDLLRKQMRPLSVRYRKQVGYII